MSSTINDITVLTINNVITYESTPGATLTTCWSYGRRAAAYVYAVTITGTINQVYLAREVHKFSKTTAKHVETFIRNCCPNHSPDERQIIDENQMRHLI